MIVCPEISPDAIKKRKNIIRNYFLVMSIIFIWFFSHSNIKAHASTVYQYNETKNETITFVTPEMFGAIGDGVTDDTLAIQMSVDSGYPVLLLPKSYLTSKTIMISGKASITGGESMIIYTGNDFAIRLTGINNYCNIALGGITALNGSGIEFYCNSKQSRCQYINLSFSAIAALDYCICFHREGEGDTAENGWLNEIRINDGRLQAGKYGIYADAKDINCINNIKCINLTFEGVNIGAHMANGCRGWSFINTRVAEMVGDGQLTFETEGSMVGLNIIMNDRFKLGRTSFSTQTQGAVVAPIQGTDIHNKEIRIIGNIGEIIDGILYVYDQSMVSLVHFVNIEAYDDLNIYIRPGNYNCEKDDTALTLNHSPTNSAFTMTVSFANGTQDYITQEIRTTYMNQVFRRTYSRHDNSFSAWIKDLNEEDFDILRKEIEELRGLVSYIIQVQ